MCINSKSCIIIYSFSSQSSNTSTSWNLLNFFDLFPSSSSSAFYFIMFTFSTNDSFTSNTFDFWHLKVGAQHSLQSLCQIVLHIFFLFTILPNLNILRLSNLVCLRFLHFGLCSVTFLFYTNYNILFACWVILVFSLSTEFWHESLACVYIVTCGLYAYIMHVPIYTNTGPPFIMGGKEERKRKKKEKKKKERKVNSMSVA